MILKRSFAGIAALGLIAAYSNRPPEGHCSVLRAPAAGSAAKTPAVRAVPALGTAVLNPANPALPGGIGFSGLPSVSGAAAPALGLPQTADPAAEPRAPLPTGSASSNNSGVLPSAERFAAELGKTKEGRASSSGRIRAYFDGGAAAASNEQGAGPVPAAYSGHGNRSGLARAALDGSDLARLYPRVVFLQDVFAGRAPDETADYVQKLVDAGVHVVFLTWRPQKGPGSAEEVLLDRVKTGRTNPVIVVSHNGGKIAPHSRANNPKSILEDLGAFTESDIAAFVEMKAAVEESLGLAGIAGEASPSAESAFTYVLRLPDTVPAEDAASERGRMMRAFNSRLASAELPYKMQAHPDDPRAVMMQSMPLRFSMSRVVAALEAQFKGEGIAASPEKWLILADSRKSPKFSKSFPKQAEIQVIRSAADAADVMGAVLGDKTLQPVSIKLGKLRQFVEYWEPSRHWLAADDDSAPRAGGGSVARSADERVYSQKFAMFTGSVMYQLMAWFYEQVWRGQHKLTSLKQLEIKLQQMWRDPAKNGVYVNKQLALLMRTPRWRQMSRGYLAYAQSYLRNFWFREFGDYMAAANHVMENFVGLATDRKSLITLNFKSPSTGRLYKIFTRIPRVMKLDTAKGRVLTAHAYRTGKETPDDGEEIYAKTLAMALLVGHGRKGEDGKWRHGSPNGPVLAKLEVQFEYRSSNRVWTFDADELLSVEDDGRVTQGPIVQELTGTIERMEADEEYQAYYAEQEQEATQEDLKKPTRGPSKKKTPAKPAVKKRATGKTRAK